MADDKTFSFWNRVFGKPALPAVEQHRQAMRKFERAVDQEQCCQRPFGCDKHCERRREAEDRLRRWRLRAGMI